MNAATPRPALLDLAHLRWQILLVGMIASGVLAMSVHVVMFDVMLVPHPELASVPLTAVYANDALSVAATIWLCRLMQPELLEIPIAARCLLVSALYAMLGEALLRNFLMDGVVSNAWRFSLIENLTRPVEDLVLGSLVVLVTPRVWRSWQLVAAGLAIAAVSALLLNPLISAALGRLTAFYEYLDTGNIYNPPYGWQVNVPSYLTFAEPVLACFVIVAAAWPRLSGSTGRRLAIFTMVIMAIKGSIVPTLVYSFFQPLPLWPAVVSEGQFGLETLVMAVLTGLTWHLSRRRD